MPQLSKPITLNSMPGSIRFRHRYRRNWPRLPIAEFSFFIPRWGILPRQFKMNQIALEKDGKEPSPRYLKEMVDVAHAQHIHIVFIQKEFDSENALQLSHEINGEVVIIDPLDYNWEKQMIDIAEKIASQK